MRRFYVVRPFPVVRNVSLSVEAGLMCAETVGDTRACRDIVRKWKNGVFHWWGSSSPINSAREDRKEQRQRIMETGTKDSRRIQMMTGHLAPGVSPCVF